MIKIYPLMQPLSLISNDFIWRYMLGCVLPITTCCLQVASPSNKLSMLISMTVLTESKLTQLYFSVALQAPSSASSWAWPGSVW